MTQKKTDPKPTKGSPKKGPAPKAEKLTDKDKADVVRELSDDDLDDVSGGFKNPMGEAC